MRSLLPCLLAALASAGGSYHESGIDQVRDNPAPRASLEVDADQLEILVRIEVTAPTRAAADSRMRVLSAKISGRFEDRDGTELARLEHTFASPKSSGRSGKGSLLGLGKGDKEPEAYVASSLWAFRASVGDDVTTSADDLRTLTKDLLDPAAANEETESIHVNETTFRLSNAEDYRDALLHRIREDAAAAARHLPEGENRLELPTLEQRVRVAPLTDTHFVIWLPYSLKHKSQVTADDGHCDCDPGEPTEEPDDKDDDSK